MCIRRLPNYGLRRRIKGDSASSLTGTHFLLEQVAAEEKCTHIPSCFERLCEPLAAEHNFEIL